MKRDSQYLQPIATKKQKVEVHKEMKKITFARTGYNARVQGQVNYQDGNSGLYVMTAYIVNENLKREYIFDKIYPWVWIIAQKHEKYRCKEEKLKTFPIHLQPALYKRKKPTTPIFLSELLNNIATSSDPEDKRVYNFYKDKYPLPSIPFTVDLVHANSNRGDLIFYKSFHGNVSSSRPSIVQHLDYVKHEFFNDGNHPELVKQRFESFSACPHTIAHDYELKLEPEYKLKKNGSTAVTIPSHDIARALMGEKSWDDINDDCPQILTSKDKQTLHKQGFLAVDLGKKLTPEAHEQWMKYVDNAHREFIECVNYCIFERVNSPLRLPLDTSHKLYNIFKGGKDSAAQTGNTHILYLSDVKDGERVYRKNPLYGANMLISKNAGMGKATRLFGGTHQLELSNHPIVFSCYKTLYGTKYLHNCSEQGRIKCGTGNKKHDILPQKAANMMQCHEDRFYTLL